MAGLLCCGLAAACQYLQQEEPAPEKGGSWSTAYGGNGPLPGSAPECATDFECNVGEICIDRRCVDELGSGGGSSEDAGPSVRCVDPGAPKSGILRPYALPEGVEKVGCGQELGSFELLTLTHVSTGFGMYYGALNSEDFGAAAACGACLEITRDGFAPIAMTVVEECPEPDCAPGDISLSAAGLTDFGVAPGELPEVSWRHVECPTSELVAFRLEDPVTVPAAVQVQGHRYRITVLEANVAGAWQPATRRADNYWVLPPGALFDSAYMVRATDYNGATVEASLLLVPEEQYSSQQFPTCR